MSDRSQPGRALCPFAIQRIKSVVESTDGVLCCHDVDYYPKGGGIGLTLAIRLHGSLSLARAGEISKEVEEALLERFPELSGVQVSAAPDGCPTCEGKTEGKAVLVVSP